MTALTNSKVFAGNANLPLAKSIARSLTIPLGKVDVDKFSDKEIRIELNEPVRMQNVFIIQPICAPANDNLMEFLIMSDAIRRSAPNKVIGVIPYYGYARQPNLKTVEGEIIKGLIKHDLIKKYQRWIFQICKPNR